MTVRVTTTTTTTTTTAMVVEAAVEIIISGRINGLQQITHRIRKPKNN